LAGLKSIGGKTLPLWDYAARTVERNRHGDVCTVKLKQFWLGA